MVTVIVPTYNYGRYISDCITSLQNQSFENWECLIIDNASTDDTASICGNYASDSRVKYIRLESNQGPAIARNVGLRMAKGDYVLFLDSDDLIESEKLNKSVKYLETHPETDLVYGDMRYFKDANKNKLYFSYACSDVDDKAWMSYTEGQGKNLVQELLRGNIMVISSPVFRAEVLKNTGLFDEQISYNEDWDLWLRMALNNKAFKYLDAEATKALIRTHSTSTSRDVFKMQVCGLYVLQKNAEQIASFRMQKLLEERLRDHTKAISASLIKLKKSDFLVKLELLKSMKLSTVVFKFDTQNILLNKLQLRLNLLL